jgi:hypothetical protein
MESVGGFVLALLFAMSWIAADVDLDVWPGVSWDLIE